MSLRPLIFLTAVVGLASPAVAGPPLARGPIDPLAVSRGPVEIRDEWMLAQPRMTLPATSPDVLPRGCTELSLHADWGNDFGFSQDGPAESPLADRRFLVDGEHRTIALTARRGIGRGLDLTLRLPIQWRGAGILDPFIDAFHDATGTLDNDRPAFDENRYRIEGRDEEGDRFTWNDSHGTGLGNIEFALRKRLLASRRVRVAAVARFGLPTGTGPFRTDSWEVGLQCVGAWRLHRRWDLYGGLGGTWYSEEAIRGIEYEPWRGYGFLAVEFRFARAWSLVMQSDASTRLVRNLAEYPGHQWYVAAGLKGDLGRGWRFVLGFTENLENQQSTSDVSGWTSLEKRF
jgi:hypothetical protein